MATDIAKSQASTAPSSNPALQNLPTNPRGIPTAPYFENLSAYGIHSRSDVEPTLRSFQEMISKYQFMELNTSRRAEGLTDKIPEMKGTLETVRFLQRKASQSSNSAADGGDDEDSPSSKEMKTTFSLNDTLYAHATVDTSTLTEVYLWLGANVMVAYPLNEAVEMLATKLDGAKRKLKECEEDGEFLREQITTLEVATARVYNWDVVERRKEKSEGGDETGNEETKKKGKDEED